MLKRMKGDQRKPETEAGVSTTVSSKTNNKGSKDKTTGLHQDEIEKKPPLMDHQHNSPPIGRVDPPQNLSPQFSNDFSHFSNDFQFSNRFSSAISSSLNSCEEGLRRGLDWDQEVESVFMEEIDKMARQID